MDISIAQRERFHDIINIHLYLQVELFRGQFLDADIEIERTGNPYQWGTRAATNLYSTDGPGFALVLRSVYPEPDQSTAVVEVLSIAPSTDAARAACDAWVTSVLAAKVPPRDLFAEMLARVPMNPEDLARYEW